MKQKYIVRLNTSISNHFIVGLALIYPLFGTDYTYYNMPQSIFVNGNVQDTITARPGNGDMTTIGSGRNPSLNISGSNNAIYSLQVKSPTNVNGVTYYLGWISVKGSISATIYNVHTLSLETGSISVGSGASLHVISSGNRINAQFSDYGGESKVRFSKRSKLTLSSNSNAKFTNATFFIHDGIGNIANQSTLEAQAITIRLQGDLNNRGDLKLAGEVYNIGRPINIFTNGVSNMTNLKGTITINGNLYNGGQAKIDTTGSFGGFNVFDPPFGGGGNIMLYGGNMNVMGNIISSQGGNLISGGGISNARNSSIGIYGATLTANNLTNKIGSSILFGVYNDDMGKFTGAFNNENSQNASIIIDIAGAKAGTYQIINGNLSGNITIGTHVQLNNGNTEFASTSLGSNNNNQWNGSVTLSINEQAIKSFKSSLNANYQAILSSFGDRIYTLQGATRTNIAKDIKELNKALQSQFLLTPFNLIDTIKSNTKLDPYHIVLQSATRSFISDVNAIGGGVAGSLGGGFGGIKAGLGYRLVNMILYSNVAYMYASMQGAKNDFVLLDSEFLDQSHSIGLNFNTKTYFLTDGKLELDIGLGYFVSLIDSNRNVKLNLSPMQNFGSNYGVHQFSLDSQLAYRIEIENLSISPRAKFIQSYNSISGFSESTNLSNNNIAQSISVPQYNAYYMSIAIGTGANWRLGSNKYITFGLDYEHFLFSTQDFHLIFQNRERISFSSPYTSRIGVVIGGRFAINNNINLGIEGVFKTTINGDTNIYCYGANWVFSYLF